MGNTQVTSLHPVLVGADSREPNIVKNVSGNTVYYRSQPFVSSATNDGNLTENQEVTIYGNTWFVTKAVELASNKKEEPVDGEIRVFDGPITLPSTSKIEIGNIEPATMKELANKKLLVERSVVIKESEAETTASTPFLLTAVGTQVKAAAALAKFGEVIPDFFLFKTADWALDARTAQVTLEVDIVTEIAPVANITFGLYKVTLLAETEKQTEITVTETPVATALFTAPAAKSGASVTATPVTLTTNTLYILGFALSAATAAKSLVTAHVRLFVTYA